MNFHRQTGKNWQRQVPGARWFKADLHLHTIDDHPGRRAKMPAGVSGRFDSPETLTTYARHFPQALVRHGIQVAGLTPHSPRAGTAENTSVVWRIVEEWNGGTDDDGIPFREKVYAVFPGFEPSLNSGREGLHILFLFDPEIGRERYLRAFDLVMGGLSPWRDGTLQMSSKDAGQAFEDLRALCERDCSVDADDDGQSWDYLVLAPHIDADKGLLGAQKAQVLQLFDHGAIAGLELPDGKLPEDTTKNRSWLLDGMTRHGQAFFHASDAYGLDDIGRRHVWTKLASPRIEGLRQAFIASKTRMRIGFEKGEDGGLRPIDNPPDVTLSSRPWLREVTVRGGAAFFGGGEGGEVRETRFRISPDFTCVIGGSMTGKSTLLDGLRVYAGATLPDDESVGSQVRARGRLFAAGTPKIELDCPGSDPTAPPRERWPARFFAQNELQRLSQGTSGVQDILAKLVPSEIEGIESRFERLRQVDRSLSDAATQLEESDERIAEAEQAHQRAKNATQALAAFAAIGVDRLHHTGRERQAWEDAHSVASTLTTALSSAFAMVSGAPDIPQLDEKLLRSEGIDPGKLDFSGRWARVADRIEAVLSEARKWGVDARKVLDAVTTKESRLRAEVEGALGERGQDAAKLKEFQELNRQASLLPRYEEALVEERRRRHIHDQGFMELHEERRGVVEQQRNAFARVANGIEQEFGGRIRVQRRDNGDDEALERFLEALRQRGITRWWRDLSADGKPSPETLVACLEADTLGTVGMSSAVRDTFRESMTRSRRRQLAALRCPDLYFLELRVDGGDFRRLDELSGGQRVGVLLTLLLETADDRPLVIDQPEDELDNRFLFDTVLPALKRLRARRQVIVATHNPNIVVNGDADMVIYHHPT